MKENPSPIEHMRKFIGEACTLSAEDEKNLRKILDMLFCKKNFKVVSDRFYILKTILTDTEYKIAKYVADKNFTLRECAKHLNFSYSTVVNTMSKIYAKTADFIDYREHNTKIESFKKFYRGN